MPSTSKKQHNFMAAVANNPAFAKKAGVPQSVGKDFSNADKGKFKRSIEMPIRPKDKSIDEMKKDAISNSVAERGYKKGGMPMKMKDGKKVPIFMNKGGTAKKMNMGGMAYAKGGGVESKGKTKGKMVKMNMGGKAC